MAANRISTSPFLPSAFRPLSNDVPASKSHDAVPRFLWQYYYIGSNLGSQEAWGPAWGVMMAEIVKLAKFRRSRTKAIEGKSESEKLPRRQKGHKWPSFRTDTLSMPLATELMKSRETAPPMPQGQSSILESGVLAFRRESNGEPLILLISKKRSKKWGIPKGKILPHLGFPENAAKEAFEEAGVIGYISPSSVGMFRAKKRSANPLLEQQIIEVWVYLLQVTETLSDWPEKGKRTTRWVSCEAAAGQLREPVLVNLCHRLAQS
jgi:8-oxo-dGTP pyrophosphatase MutT (NUDIX family)